MRLRGPGPRPLATLAAGLLSASLLAFAGCGDEETTTTTAAPLPASSTTGPTASTTTSSTTTATTTTAGSSTTTPTTSSTVPETSAPATGGYDPDQADSADNDKPPTPGSPQEAFEQACAENPSTCG